MKLILLPAVTGFGHISRCIAIAKAVNRLNHNVETSIIMSCCEEEVEYLLRSFKVKTAYYENYEELKKIIEQEQESMMIVEDWVFFPYHLIDPKSFVYSLLVQPNLNYPKDRLEKADLLLSCSPAWYIDPQLIPYQQKMVNCGPQLHLTEEQETLTKEESRRYLGIKPQEFVLTVLGGGGAYSLELYDLVAESILSLKKTYKNLSVFFLVGPFASCYGIKPYQQKGIVKRCVLSTFPYLKASDVIVSHGGYQTIMEALKTKTPAIFFPRNAEQEANLGLFSFPWFFRLKTLSVAEFLELLSKASAIKEELIPEKIINGAEQSAKNIFQFLSMPFRRLDKVKLN